jgi:hypothetical protein
MTILPDKFVRWSAKDFFFLMLRDTVPRDPSGVEWHADEGAQPEPTWLPGFFSGRQKLGQLEVNLTSIEPGRVTFRVRAGSREPSPIDAPPKKLELSSDESKSVLAAIGLGHTTPALGFGLAFDGAASLALKTSLATVVVSQSGELDIEAPGARLALNKGDEAVQLPLLAEGGHLTAEAREQGSLTLRAALCLSPQGRLVIAQARHDSDDAITNALIRLGCTRVVGLDRGARHPAFVHRVGSATPPIQGYETTVLYALARAPTPRAFRWKHAEARPSTTPSSYDVELSDKKKRALGILD